MTPHPASGVKPRSRAPRRASRESKRHSPFTHLDPAVRVALHFGFSPITTPFSITKSDRERASALGEEAGETAKPAPATLASSLPEKVAVLRYCEERKLDEGPQPIELAYMTGGGAKSPERTLSLEIIGAGRAIAEAILVETAFAILREEGHENLSLSVNSIGDRDSSSRFMRELGNYYRRNLAQLPPACKTLVRQSSLEALLCAHEKCRALADAAPKSLAFLGDASRKHLAEMLEYAEELEIPYRVNPLLFGNRAFATDTIFEIRSSTGGAETLLAAGCRYNALARRLGWRRDSPAVGLKIILARAKRAPKRQSRYAPPKIFFLQIGTKAKLKSLKVIELLRKAGIALEHALAREKLLSQQGSGENARHPYSLIIGQREALEETVIIRNNTTRAQETVAIGEAAVYIKKLRIV